MTTLLVASSAWCQAPEYCDAVMIQGFYWDSYKADDDIDKPADYFGPTTWSELLSQVDELSASFDMIWLPPSAKSSGGVGYHPKQWCNQNGEWGTEAELKTLIAAFHNNDTRVIADIVINHRDGNTTWTDFFDEDFGAYGQFTLSPGENFICADDECKDNGFEPKGNNDAGYDLIGGAWGGYAASRDLDHSNLTVQEAIKAYLKWMKNEIGYDGWRFDLVKGYLGKYIEIYTKAADAYYSVGEYWDGSYDALKKWVNDTGWNSTCFDFCAKYSLYNGTLSNGDYRAMTNMYNFPNGLCGADEMKRYATTFVDNHDTFRDVNRFSGNWDKANAVLLASPGIPCVFYPHWVSCKSNIQNMIAARKACGIHSQSPCVTDGTCESYYRSVTTGTKGKLVCYVGHDWTAPSDCELACCGDGWAFYTQMSNEKFYIAGNGSEGGVWCDGNTWIPDGVELKDNATYTVAVEPGEYIFKITDGTWLNSWGYSSVNGSSSTPGYTSNENDNICFSVEEPTLVSIYFDAATRRINLKLTDNNVTTISNVKSDGKGSVRKYLKDGQMIIEKDGVRYNIAGCKME